MAQRWSINEINSIPINEFAIKFHNIVECCPNIGRHLAHKRPFQTIDNIIEEASNLIQQLDDSEKETILKLHPDLAGRLADEGKLTPESKREQVLAGLDKILAEDKAKLREFNQKYRQKFGFPFVICARENKFVAILDGIQRRLHNQKAEEIIIGTEEVKKICRLRILELVDN